MQNLSKGYLMLFNTLTQTEEALARLRSDLMAAQQQAEELYLEADTDQDGCDPEENPVQ